MAYALHGSALHLVTLGSVIVLAGVLLATAAVARAVMFALSIHGERVKRSLGILSVGSSAVLLSATISLVLGLVLAHRSVDQAQSWFARQVPALEAYQALHGEYPTRLEDVADLSSAPRLVISSERPYVRVGRGFVFTIEAGQWVPLKWASFHRHWGSD